MCKRNKINKIMICGFSGSGKSTLAQTLGKKFGIEPVHLDSIYWLPGWKEMPKEKMKKIVGDIIKKDKWIIEGNYFYSYGEERIQKADMVIFLDFNRFLCLYRVIKRYFIYKGKTRPDMGKDCNEKIDLEFIKWVLIDEPKKRAKYYKLLGDIDISKKRVYVIKSPGEMKKFLEMI